MKIKLGTISVDPEVVIKAYLTKLTATDDQKNLAKARLDICSKCSYRKVVGPKGFELFQCGVCGCALSGKIYVQQKSACSKHFWDDVDNEYFSVRAVQARKGGKLV